MSVDSMTGEITTYGFGFAPKGYLPCNGTMLPIAQNQALFAVIGTAFGGDGVKTFALPDLRGRVPMHFGNNLQMGQAGGEEKHTLTVAEMPAHNHSAYGTTATADQGSPANNIWASNTGQVPYSNQPNTSMSTSAISQVGGSQGHENMSPFLALNFGICSTGTFGGREGTLGEIILYAGQRVSNPDTWAPCNGQIMSIQSNTALFAVLGTTYGGNGVTTFALPNLQGLAAMQCGQGPGLSMRALGNKGGEANVTVGQAQMPNHTHQALAAASASTSADPTDNTWATGGETRGGVPFYAAKGAETSFHTGSLAPIGGEQPHNNMPPFLGVNFMICLQGIYPQRP